MKPIFLLTAFTIIFTSCKKSDAPSGCYISNATMGSQRTEIAYNTDGSMLSIGGLPVQLFNNGSPMLTLAYSDTVTFDENGRVQQVNLPFESNKRQTRRYEYDGQGQIFRTTTITGDTREYWTELEWKDGDLTSYKFRTSGVVGSNDFKIEYYEHVAMHSYAAMHPIQQVGSVFSKHLVQRVKSAGGSTEYSYTFDSEGRVTEVASTSDGGRSYRRVKYGYTCF